jgi:hypothetical protein
MIYVRVAALIWAIWCTRNGNIFEKNNSPLLCRLYLRESIVLQREDTKESIRATSKTLEIIALEIFAKND